MLHGIRLRLLGLVVIATIPFLALIGAGLWSQWRNEQAQAMQLALSEARRTATLVDDHVGNLDNLLAGLSYAVSLNPADTAANDTLLRRAKMDLPDFVANIMLFALDGSNIGIAEGRRFSAADRRYFQKVLEGEKLAMGEPIQGRAVGGWIVTLARPVEDRAGNLRGVLAIGTSLERFQSMLTGNGLPEGALVRVVNESSVVISEGVTGPNRLGRELVEYDKGVLHVVAKDTAQNLRWSDNVNRITGSSSSHRTRWLISVGLPPELVLAPLAARMEWSGLFSIGALTIMFVIAWMVSGRLVRPLTQLARDASILADGDLSHRTEVASDDEVGHLAASFNQMATALEQREDDAQLHAEEVQQTKDTLAAVVDASPIAIACTGLDRRIILWNRAAEQIYGYTKEEAIGHSVKMVPPEGTEVSRGLYQRALNRETIRDVEVKRMRKDGSLVDVCLAVAPMYNTDGSVRGVAWAHEDITVRKRAEEQLRRFAHFDQLTGLPNRLTMRKELEARLAASGTDATTIALFDLDGFKDVNDTLGHSTGDRLLIEVGRRLMTVAQECAPPCQVCRLGGDEFVTIIPDCGDPRTAAEIIGRMLKSLAEPFDISDHVLHLAGSTGIAIAPNDGKTVDDLIANADLALYQAKKVGGGVYRFFVPSMRAKVQSRRALDIEMRRAFSGREFEMHYQPQVQLRDGAVIGAEALIRWRHPDRGIIAPALFIDALADSAIAPDVGRWILETACMQTAAWRDMGYSLSRIAVNLFSAHLHHPSLVEDVENVLRKSGLPPEVLELEIIENVALSNDSSIKPLQRLHEKGVNLAFDDFGTGYASLSYLTLFPVSHIKIDRSFVDKVGNSAQDAAIVRSLIAMGHSLELDVIAEGVETEEQAAFLLNEGCLEAQGYLYSRPLDAAAFEAYLRNARFSHSTAADSDRRMAHAAGVGTRSIARPLRRRKMR